MTKRRKWTAIPGLVALAAGAVMLSAYSGASSSQGSAPTQPIAFSHPVHVQKLGINCIYCHYAANKSMDPGLPAVSTCMGCHTIVTATNPAVKQDVGALAADIDKLTKYAAQNHPIPWIRIHKVPEYVHFPHMRHVNAGVTCQTCHGQVQKMMPVYQASSLNMGWCVSCHVNGYSPKEGLEAAGYSPDSASKAAEAALLNPAESHRRLTVVAGRIKARYDCAACHY